MIPLVSVNVAVGVAFPFAPAANVSTWFCEAPTAKSCFVTGFTAKPKGGTKFVVRPVEAPSMLIVGAVFTFALNGKPTMCCVNGPMCSSSSTNTICPEGTGGAVGVGVFVGAFVGGAFVGGAFVGGAFVGGAFVAGAVGEPVGPEFPGGDTCAVPPPPHDARLTANAARRPVKSVR